MDIFIHYNLTDNTQKSRKYIELRATLLLYVQSLNKFRYIYIYIYIYIYLCLIILQNDYMYILIKIII